MFNMVIFRSDPWEPWRFRFYFSKFWWIFTNFPIKRWIEMLTEKRIEISHKWKFIAEIWPFFEQSGFLSNDPLCLFKLSSLWKKNSNFFGLKMIKKMVMFSLGKECHSLGKELACLSKNANRKLFELERRVSILIAELSI